MRLGIAGRLAGFWQADLIANAAFQTAYSSQRKLPGLLRFVTIIRNPLATFVTFTMAENWLKLLFRGTDDSKMFTRPTGGAGGFGRGKTSASWDVRFWSAGGQNRRAVFGW